MLMSFTEYNDIVKMSEYHRKAYAYLKRISSAPRSSVFRGTMPWAVGVPSIISMYWNESGRLPELLDAMDDCLPIYSELASGHGAGAEIVFRAEAALARGDDVSAEVLCHKAFYRAHGAHQLGVCLSAELVLAEIAIVRGDADAYVSARNNIAKTAEEASQRSVFRMGELCLGVLDLDLGMTEGLSNWLYTIEGIQKTLYTHAASYGLLFYGHLLLHEKSHARLRGLTDHVLPLAQAMHYILPQIYHHLYLAVADMREGHKEKATTHAKAALRLALPDNMYLPVAKFYTELSPVFENLHTESEFKGIDELLALGARYVKDVEQIRNVVKRGESNLTPREKEVAVLAQERLSAGVIAAKLFISVNTVNTILKNVYRKLGVAGKSDLKNRKL